METIFTLRAISILICIGSLHAGDRINENIFHVNERETKNLSRHQKKRTDVISSTPAKSRLFSSKSRLASSASVLSTEQQRNLQFTFRRREHKMSLLNAFISERKASYKINKLQRRDACTGAGTSGGIQFADCDLVNPNPQTTASNAKPGPFQNPDAPQPDNRMRPPFVQAPPEVLTTPSNKTYKTTVIISSTPPNMVLATNHSLTGQSKPSMTIISALTTTLTHPSATTSTFASKGYYPKTKTDTVPNKLTLPVINTSLPLTTIQGTDSLKMTTTLMPLTTRYRQSTSVMESSTPPQTPLQTMYQDTTTLMMTTGPDMNLSSDNTFSLTVTFATTVPTLSNERPDAYKTITAANRRARTTTHLLTGSSERSKAHSATTIVSNDATISLPLATINVTPVIVATPHTKKYSSGTNGGFFTRPDGIAVIAVITEVTSVVLASVCIYCFVSGIPCMTRKDQGNHKETLDKENYESDTSPYTSMETLSSSISSKSTGSDVLLTPVESPDLAFI